MIEPSKHVISQDDMTRFAGLRSMRARPTGTERRGSHHTDPAVARQAGLSGTVAQALHYCAYVGQLLLEEGGKNWLEGGELEMKFVRPLYAGDSVEVRLAQGEDGVRRIECVNQDGQVLAFGTATFAGDA